MSQTLTQQPLHVLDADLPYIASEAAVEIDNLIAGHSEEPTAFKDLVRRLDRSFGDSALSEEPRYMVDAGTLTVVDEAIRRAGGGATPNLSDVVKRAVEIAALPDPQSAEHRGDFEWALDFCLALSRAAAAYRRSIYDLQPKHPFRR